MQFTVVETFPQGSEVLFTSVETFPQGSDALFTNVEAFREVAEHYQPVMKFYFAIDSS